MTGSIEKKVIEEFNKHNINYLLLRNYEKIENSKDLDILLDAKDARKVKKILIKLGLVKKIFGIGPYLISDKMVDVKVGCMEFGKNFTENAKDVLKRKIKYKDLYILNKEDELEHLILKPLGNRFTKKKYITKIENLFKTCNYKKVEQNFSKRYGKIGLLVLNEVKNKNYKEAKKLKTKFHRSIRSITKLAKYYFYRIKFTSLKR